MAVGSTQQIAPAGVERWRFTVDDFCRMGEVGILPPEARVELIDGEVIRMDPIGHGHGGKVKLLNHLFGRLLDERGIVSVQDPLQIRPRGQPQPDIMVLRPRADFYSTSHPTADDVLLLVEVAESSLEYDRETKAPIYAQAGIADYWIVNVVDAQIIVLRQPVDGVYQSVQTLVSGDVVQPLAFPDITISVSEILS